jgi:hypothetical protein
VELATMLRRGLQLPAELPQTLDVQHIHESSPSAFPNGCHIAEVEIDPETGVVAVAKYSMVNARCDSMCTSEKIERTHASSVAGCVGAAQ